MVMYVLRNMLDFFKFFQNFFGQDPTHPQGVCHRMFVLMVVIQMDALHTVSVSNMLHQQVQIL